MVAAFIPLLVVLFAGTLFRYIPGVPTPEQIRKVIGALALNLLLPALVLDVTSTAELTLDSWAIPIISATCVIVCAATASCIYVGIPFFRSKLDRTSTGALILASAWCNATYLGYPIVTSIMGADYGTIPIFFDVLAMSPLLFTLGMLIGQRFGDYPEGRAQPSSGTNFIKSLISPPIIALALGLTINGLGLTFPIYLTKSLKLLSSTLTPLMIMSIGTALRIPRARALASIAPAAVIKLIMAPLIAVVLAPILMTDHRIQSATILEAGMPTMMLTMMYAEKYGLDSALLADTIFFTTILSLVTLPLIGMLVS